MQSSGTFDEVFLFSSQGLPETTFHVARFTGTEGLNELFLFRILLVCNDAEVDTDRLLHSPARFTIRRENGEDAVFTGYPTLVEQGGFFNGYAYYTVELRPTLWKLTRIVKSAIFLEQDVQAVADVLLNSEKFLSIPREFRFTRSDYPRPEFAMQYEETLYDYMQWRLEEQGAYFYFSPDGDTVIFADSPSSHDTSAGTVFYSPTSGLETGHISEVVTSFTLAQEQLPARVIVRGYDWKDPNRILAAMAPVSPKGLGDVVLTNEAVASEADAQRLATIRAEELLAHDRTFTGIGSVPFMRPGVVFTLDRHYRKSFNRDYMVTKITHEGSQEAMLGMVLNIPVENVPDHLSYRNTFECIASDMTFRPSRTAPRAKIAGMVHAFIDGGDGEGKRPFLDENGRYKLLFPFDVSGRSAGKRSCWIRRAQEQVGKDCGMSFPLLPGTEVLVGFIDGNPDRPVITGALANGETGALTGSGNANISGIRTPGGNQITINDTDSHQGMSFLTASGNGITMSSGSIDWEKKTKDLGLDAASVGSSSMTSLFQGKLCGASDVAMVAKMSKDKALWLAGKAALTAGSGVFSSLSENAPKSEGLAWGAGAFKAATLLLDSIQATTKIKKIIKNDTDQPFGYDVFSSEGSVIESKQCNQSPAELVTLILLMLASRAAGFTTGILSSKDVNDTPNKEDEEKKFKEELPIPEDTTTEEAIASYQQAEWEKYTAAKKKAAIRKAVVSQVSDLLPELTAIITTSLWAKHLGDKILGGIRLNASEQNIHIKAATYTGVHAGQGILLNTERLGDGGTLKEWGAPRGVLPAAGIADSIGCITATSPGNTILDEEDAKAPDTFIAQNTDLNYQQSLRHIVRAEEKAVIVSPTIFLRDKDGSFFSDTNTSTVEVVLESGECTIDAQEKYSLYVSGNDNDFTKYVQKPGNINLSNADSSCIILDNDKVSLNFKQDNSFVGLQNNQAQLAAAGGNNFVNVTNQGVQVKADTVNIGGVIVEKGAVKGNDKAVLEIGGAIKVTGCSATLDLKQGVIDFAKQLHAISNENKKNH